MFIVIWMSIYGSTDDIFTVITFNLYPNRGAFILHTLLIIPSKSIKKLGCYGKCPGAMSFSTGLVLKFQKKI